MIGGGVVRRLGRPARYAHHIEEILRCDQGRDDRVEVPRAATWRSRSEHPLTKGCLDKNIVITGYNRITPDRAKVIVSNGRDPMLVVGSTARARRWRSPPSARRPGRTMLKWEGYAQFWVRMIRWLAGRFEAPKAP